MEKSKVNRDSSQPFVRTNLSWVASSQWGNSGDKLISLLSFESNRIIKSYKLATYCTLLVTILSKLLNFGRPGGWKNSWVNHYRVSICCVKQWAARNLDLLRQYSSQGAIQHNFEHLSHQNHPKTTNNQNHLVKGLCRPYSSLELSLLRSGDDESQYHFFEYQLNCDFWLKLEISCVWAFRTA